MREIKHHGKRIDNGKWIVGDLLQGIDGRKYIVTLCDNIGTWTLSPRLLISEVVPETVGQFTGLLDRSGTEIFEGGIVLYSGQPMTVTFNLKYAQWRLVAVSDTRGMNVYCKSDYEVIGNIHENPELLEATS